jgi:hypothetical protein
MVPRYGWTYFQHNALAFVDNDTLAVSLFIRKPGAPTPTSGKVGLDEYLSENYSFESVFLNARTGTVQRTQVWSNASSDCGFFPVSGGRFVIRDSLELALYGADGSKLKSVALDPRSFRFAPVKQSPSGATLFVIRTDRGRRHVLCLRSSDLQETAHFDLDYFEGAGSDSYFAALQYTRGEEVSPLLTSVARAEVLIYGRLSDDPQSRKLARVFTTTQDISGELSFLDDETLALREGHEWKILDVSGKVLYQCPLGKDGVGAVAPCRNCDLVAYETHFYTGGFNLFDYAISIPSKMHERQVVILCRSTKQRVELPSGFTRRLGTFPEPRLALSPNGCTLAHQVDWKLELYRICGTEIGRQLGFEAGNGGASVR